MPQSRKRKKKGKVVKSDTARRSQRLEEMSSGVTMQDLINVLAYQEYVKDGTILAENAKVNIPDEIPVTVGEGENKRQVGTAVQVEGRDELSVRITDHDTIQHLSDPGAKYSISTEDEENKDGR